MNRAEFDEWFRYHCGAFRNLADWFAKLGPEKATETLDHWFRTLRNVDLDEASRATEQLFSGDEPEPKSRDKIPAAIRAIAKRARPGGTSSRESRPMYVDGEPVYECNLCDDDGRISLKVRGCPEDAFPGLLCDTSFACTCRHGDFWVKQGCTRAPHGVKPGDTVVARQARPLVGEDW